jgi:flagellar basal-body rod modification protein FlgD
MDSLAVGSVSPGAVQPSGGLQTLRSEDFFKMLITELQQQDPLQPAKTQDMIGQVSQIRSIELSKQLTDTLDVLSRQQRTSGASELLGKFVSAEYADPSGQSTTIAGVVTGVRFAGDGSAVLELDTGQTIRAADVALVSNGIPTAAGAPAGTSALTAAPPQNAAAAQTAKPAAESPLQNMLGEYHRPKWLKRILPF